MKRRLAFRPSFLLVIAAALACAALPLLAAESAAKAPAEAAPAAGVPLLDRELFFGDPEISGAQISPDGKFIAFIKPLKGTRNVWVKKTSEPFDAARPLTDDTKRPIMQYFWSRDGKFILFAQDNGGDENYNIFAVDPAAKPAEGREVPAARNLTDLKGVRAQPYAVPKNDPDTIYVGLNDRDAAWHDLYKVKISTGARELMRKNTDRIAGWFFDNAGALRLAVRSADNGDTQILRVDPDKFTEIYSCSVLEGCGPTRFDGENKRVYMETNKGSDLTRLTLFDPQTGKEELVESDPLKRVDFGGAIFSEKTNKLVATTYEDERERVYFRDKAWQADYEFLTKKLPGKEISPGSMTADESIWMISASSDLEPGERWLFERATKKLTFQYRNYEKLPREALAPMKAVKYPSSDGLEIPAFLTVPKGVPAKNLPLVVFPHGGPWYRDSWRYHPYAQFLANRGYAVLQPNFRGSTGYGKKFIDAGNKQWGDKMQDDLTWGVKYLVGNGTVDAKRVAIMGGSYGGYATLAGVTFTPDLYAAAVSIVGPSNLLTLLETIPPYWEAGRKVFHARMGDPNTPEGKAQLERQSPLNSAAKIKTPLLVVQGANDPRVKKAESDQIVIALRDRGFPVEYIVAPDEGHGFARPVNNMAMFAAAERFLAKHVGGRFQEGATPEVATRLTEITVDPKTVTLAKKVDAASVGLPKATGDLAPGKSSWQAKIEAGGQSIPLSMAREIAADGDRWVVTDTAKTPMGDVVDKTVLAKGSLAVLARNIKQGPVTIDLEFKDGKASGKMAMGTDPKPIAVDLGGPLFADGAGSDEALAQLALADGYTTTFRNFDVQTQKAALKQLKVLGSEKVTVPAGTFDALKCEITSADGGAERITIWVAKDARRPVKSSAVLPQMGGAVMTAELLP